MKFPFSIKIETLGCRLNQVESEALAMQFNKYGFNVLLQKENSDNTKLCIVNTCTVTGKAEQKARRLIRLLLKKYSEAIILVTGCYAELEAETIEKIDERIIAFSGKKKDELYSLASFIKTNILYVKSQEDLYLTVNATIKDSDCAILKSIILEFKEKIYSARNELPNSKTIFKLSAPTFMFHSRASIKVQDGCNNACSYCRIRLARGHAISLPAEEAIRRIQEIEKNGANEVVLTGVNLSQYWDNAVGDFADLLSLILKNTKNIHIRISSLYPEHINKEILPTLRNPRVCPHFHLSIQSGSDKILKAMSRQYNRDDIFRAINYLREIKDNPFIGCDIITGFPSETEEDFEQSYSMCAQLKIPGIHVFPFSARPGTVAFLMRAKVPERESGIRASKLSMLSEKNYQEYLNSCNGKVFFAIVEKPLANKHIEVITENYLTLPLDVNNSSHKYDGGEAILIKVNGQVAELYSTEVNVSILKNIL